MTEASRVCVTCGTALVGRFCHQCGEKRAEERDLTLRAFLHYAAEAVTNADAKLYVTLRRLVRRPGLLTREFVAGRRTLYVAPVQLFLLANLIFFVMLQLGVGMDTFTTDLVWHRMQPVYGATASSMIEERVGAVPAREGRPVGEWIGGWTEEQQEFRRRFNETTPRYANSMVIVMIPLFAGLVRLLRRRGLFVRDLVFSMHFYAFLLLFSVALTILVLATVVMPGHLARLAGLADVPAVDGFFRFLDRIFSSDLIVSMVIVIPMLVYLAAGFRTAYGDGRVAAVLRAVASIALLFLVLTAYRAILFFVVFWTL